MFNAKKAAERNALIRQMKSMPLDELIALGDCDFKCPPWKKSGCGCLNCNSRAGYWKSSEIEERIKKGQLTEERKIKLLRLLSRGQGALGPKGCELDRQDRSRACLEELCNPFVKVAGVFNG